MTLLRSRALPLEQEGLKLDKKHMGPRGRELSWLRDPSPFQKCREKFCLEAGMSQRTLHPVPLPHSLTSIREAGPTPPTQVSDRASETKFKCQILPPNYLPSKSFSQSLYHLLL